LPAQDLELVAQHQQLDVFHMPPATAANERTDQSPHSEADEGEGNAGDPPSLRPIERRHQFWRLPSRTDPQAAADHPQYHTRIVAEAWRLNEHEVPPEGIRVRRTQRYARGSDGRALFWVARPVDPAPRSTLPRPAFDYLE
jgi:hypothetical protein